MCTIGLISQSKQSTVTEIPNRFIDEFMLEANGTYIKVYLYLLRHLDDHRDFSVSGIAELLDCTENFLIKALNYWSRQQLLEYTVSEDGHVSSINLIDISGGSLSESKGRKAPVSAKTEPAVKPAQAAAKSTATPAQKLDLEALAEDENVIFLLTTLEQYYERPLSAAERNTALFIYASLGFSVDLELFLFEHYIGKKDANGKDYSAKYIETVAVAWKDAGISNETEAKDYLFERSEAARAVREEFGMTALGKTQLNQIRIWNNEWKMSPEMIRMACSRTMSLGKGGNFRYADSILSRWHSNNVNSPDDIEKDDLAHKSENEQKYKKTPKSAGNTAASSGAARFENFKQRQYTPEQMAAIELRMRQKKD